VWVASINLGISGARDKQPALDTLIASFMESIVKLDSPEARFYRSTNIEIALS
jgi:hypothetical protein